MVSDASRDPVIVRDAKPTVGELAAALSDLGRHLPDPIETHQPVADYAAKLLRHGWLATVVSGGRIVGLVAIYANDLETRRAFASILVVDPGHSRRGLGRTLMQKAIAEARSRGMRSMWLKARPDNEPALRLHRELGFRRTGTDGGRDVMEREL